MYQQDLISTLPQGDRFHEYRAAVNVVYVDARNDKSFRRTVLGLLLFAGLLLSFAAVTGKAYAEEITNFNQITTGWQLCTGPSCAGGSGNPTCEIQKFDISSPSLDGKSMELQLCGPAYSNNGWYYDTGAQDSDTNFTLNLEFYVPSTTYIEALEFDQFQYLHAGDGGVTKNTRLYFGTQCVTGGDWWVWDSSGLGWIDTKKACSYKVAAFNHLIIAVHRISGDTSCADGYPCMYYDITLNGTNLVTNDKTNAGALPSGWGEQTGLMLQLDTNKACGSGCTITEYIDEGDFTLTN